ncbi:MULTISPECIES: hypothetical protein [unclassified Corynebacterium]|uniref:hypothetical protein n=1 Tax=Corynebacterium TaxID=1716 RepID=UPI002550AA4E|nr:MULTISPECIES: hypothetical protein [unclassified Corynebacterium]MDK8475973.1 hypothetical protein [Corynebacterium sp. MSK310]MDK8672258.1 hypothetical protein [Corynebacterium sp. MSK189]MDK8736032.1 hypothetical protein [Corynebacterium sp. MSK306]
MGRHTINEHWFEFSKQRLDSFGAKVEDPTKEHRYPSQPDWYEIANNLRPFLFHDLNISNVSPTTARILKSWLTDPPKASTCFGGDPENNSPWQVTNGRHRLTGVMSARPDLNIPVYWDIFGYENGPYSEKVLASKIAQAELIEQERHSYLPRTVQNDRFLIALENLATKKFKKPEPKWPISTVKVQGREPDHSFLSDDECNSAFVWKHNENALIVVDSVKTLYDDRFSSDWAELRGKIPELEHIIADSRNLTVVSEVMTGFKSDVHYTYFPESKDFFSIHCWGPPIQVCICRAGVRLTRFP